MEFYPHGQVMGPPEQAHTRMAGFQPAPTRMDVFPPTFSGSAFFGQTTNRMAVFPPALSNRGLPAGPLASWTVFHWPT